MDKEYLIQLAKNAYNLTLLFPKKDPLRYKVRELADEVLEFLIPSQKNRTKRKIKIMHPIIPNSSPIIAKIESDMAWGK